MPWPDDMEPLYGTEDEPRLARGAHLLPEQQIEGQAPDPDLDTGDPTTGLSPPTQSYSDMAASTARAVPDVVTSAVEGSGLGALLDRLGGPMGGAQLFTPGEDFGARRERHRAEAAAAAERSPTAARLGGILGTVAPMLIPGPQEAEGASLLARLARGAGEGAAYAGLTSEGETPSEVAGDAVVGATGGALGTGVARGVGAAARGAGRAMERGAERADLARLSSVLGERSAPITSREMQEMVRTLGAGGPRESRVARAAQRVRETGAVGPFSTIEDILGRIRERLPQAEGRTAAIRQGFESAGYRVPADALPSALEQAARDMERDPALAEHAGRVREQAQAAREVLARIADEDGGVSLEQAERALEPLRERSGFRSLTDVPSVREAWRDALRAGRGQIDDIVAQGLGGDVAHEFPAARRDVQTLRLLEGLTEGRAGRAAMRSPLASAMAAAGPAIASGGAAIPSLLAGAGYRGLRAREASVIASGLEAVQRIVSSRGYQALGRYGPILERAAARGALPVVHQLLTQSDPEYAAAVQGAQTGPRAPSSALRPLTDETERPFDPSELEERPFDPAELE